MKKYSKTHEWTEVEGKTVTIGISDHAQELLGDVVYIELPAIGKTVKKGEILCSLESVKAAEEVFSPVSGKVSAVNGVLVDKPELINASAESEGWIVKLEFSQGKEFDELMDAATYKHFSSGE